MSTEARKAREREQREELIVEAAWDLLRKHGWHGLTMDRLAETIEYSKGTLYNHFSAKEDLLLALTVRGWLDRAELFERAAGFQGRSRERICAIDVADKLFALRHPSHFQIEHLVRGDSFWAKTAETRREELGRPELRCYQVILEIVEQGLREEDLTLIDMTPGEAAFGLRSMSLGVHTMVDYSSLAEFNAVGIGQPYATFRRNAHAYLDGLGWRPLYADHDYKAVYRRVSAEVFPEAGINAL